MYLLYLYVCVHIFFIYIYTCIHTCIHSSQNSGKPEKEIKLILTFNRKGITLSYQSLYSELYQHRIEHNKLPSALTMDFRLEFGEGERRKLIVLTPSL